MSEKKENPIRDRVRTLAEQVLTGTELFLVDVDVRGQQGGRAVDVFVDSDTGVTIDQCAAVSRDLDVLLEAEDLIKGRYNLTVSSPGASRPLIPRQFPRHVGKPLRVVQRSIEEEQVTLEGTLTAVGNASFTIKVDSGEAVEVPFDTVEKSTVKLPW